MTGERTDAERAQTRRAAMVIFIALAGWMALSALGGAMGWPLRLAFLFDLAALAAVGWALWVIIRVWRAGAGTGKGS